MKKLLFIFSFLGGLVSCTDNVVEQANLSSQGNKRMHARELLRQMNESNPYSSVGIEHNRLVSDMLSNMVQSTRGGVPDSFSESSIRTTVINVVDSLLKAEKKAGYTISEFEEDYDSLMVTLLSDTCKVPLSSPNILSAFDSFSRTYVQEISNIVYEKIDIDTRLEKLDRLQIKIKNELKNNSNQEKVLYLVSVAANSCEFWDEVLELVPDEYPGVSLGNVVGADLEAAGLTASGKIYAKLFKVAVKWKYVAVVSAGASTWEGLKNVDWSGLANRLSSWWNGL